MILSTIQGTGDRYCGTKGEGSTSRISSDVSAARYRLPVAREYWWYRPLTATDFKRFLGFLDLLRSSMSS